MTSIEQKLEHYVLSNRPHHALIFAGPETAKKKELVKKLAATFLSKNAGSTKTLIQERVLKEVHPDVFWIREENEETIKIDCIRDTCHQMEIAPLEADAKICIIENCHRMNTAASNAFLKSLEEPLPNRYFWLLTSQIGSLLPTLVSRCLIFTFPPEKNTQDNFDANLWGEFQQAWKHGRFEKFCDSFKEKSDAIAFVQILQEALRNTVVRAVHPNATVFLHFPESSLLQALKQFETATILESHLRSNANIGLLMESALTTIWNVCRSVEQRT